jgi:hypothetical protein
MDITYRNLDRRIAQTRNPEFSVETTRVAVHSALGGWGHVIGDDRETQEGVSGADYPSDYMSYD